MNHGNRFVDISGQKHGRLLVLRYSHSEGGKTIYVCLCDCGNIKPIAKSNIMNGHTTSCGCRLYEIQNIGRRTHGLSQERFNKTWRGMKERCQNSNSESYPRYGGRGVRNEWFSFEQFKNDMYETYLEHVKEFGEKDTTIERINNDGNYSKENCRWATRKEQANNRRPRIKI